MRLLNSMLIIGICVLPISAVSPVQAQTQTQQPETEAAVPNPEPKNLAVYIDLLRQDVRQQKAETMGSVMVLSAQDAAKFWPIYSEYDSDLTKLNDQRAESIKYARTYNQMTDEKANELIQNAIAYQKQRDELLAKTYDRIKQALGAITAAGFVQVEHQLLLLIDLRIVSALPIAEPES